jgi:hypothetical protein
MSKNIKVNASGSSGWTLFESVMFGTSYNNHRKTNGQPSSIRFSMIRILISSVGLGKVIGKEMLYQSLSFG